MLAKRLSLFAALIKGYDYREINKTLKFSFETTRRAKEGLETKSEKFKEILDSLLVTKGQAKTNRLFKFIELALGAKTDMKARAKLASGDY